MTLTRKTSTLILNYLNRSISSNLKSTGKHNLQNSNTFKRLNSTVCWKCGKERTPSQVFCEQCNVVQSPVQKHNYFRVFDMDEKFDIDQRQLRTRFRKLQSLLHPDKFSNKEEEEQNISAEYSSLLNKAYNNLNVPLKRAEHLLNLKGEQIGEDQGIDDPTFLMEVMELNEEVENAGSDRGKLKQLDAKNKVELGKVSEEIDRCFKSDDIRAAKRNIVKLKYYNSLNNRISGALRELGETD